MNIRTPKDWELPESSVTAQSLYRLRNRREFLLTLGVGAVGAILSPSLLRAATAGFPDKENPLYPASTLKPTAYDLKGIKSIVKIEFTDMEPRNTWNIMAPNEYGFYANVNPQVDHPRWSQARERVRDEQLAQTDLAKGSQNVLISRPGTLEVGVALLGRGDAALLTAVVGHLPFGLACEAAVLAEADYNLGSGLGNLVVARAFAALAKKIREDELSAIR
jgi:hypothetical protein